MIKNNIVIFKCNSLYQILSEIKSNLSFDIKNFIPDELDKKDLTNSIILSKLIYRDSLHQKKNINKNKIIFLLKKGEVLPITNKNQYIFYPFHIYDLLEKINIELIKQRYNDQSSINILNYSLDFNSKIISNKESEIKLTEREVEIILFLKESDNPQNVNVLQNKVWGYTAELETHTVETHIYRLRKKIADVFKDKNFIISSDDGYSIK
tara:strand:- start:481 stop:1107 length:627 start_codon:yes stop_codon:yes gene_type:complete